MPMRCSTGASACPPGAQPRSSCRDEHDPACHRPDRTGRLAGVEELRLFVHLLAATIWVGGQLVLAALVPALRAAGPAVPGAAARAFSRVAWPAFAVLLLSGIWNIAAEGDENDDGHQALLMAKLSVVAISGVTAYLHSHAEKPRSRGLYGAATGVSAVLALLLGVLLHD